MKIRKGAQNDIPAIFDLVKGLAIYEKEPDAVTVQRSTYNEAFKDDLIDFSVAEVNGQIVGFALYYMAFSTWKGKMLYLEDFFVDEKFRNQGIGQGLFDSFIEQARMRGCVLTKWEVLDWNKEAIRFYERNGAKIETQWYDGKLYL